MSHKKKSFIKTFFVALVLCAFYSNNIYCQYSNDPKNALTVNNVSNDIYNVENVKIATSGNSGKTYIAWLEDTYHPLLGLDYSIYLQLLDVDGNFLWATPMNVSGGLYETDIQLQITSNDEAIVSVIPLNIDHTGAKSVYSFKIGTDKNFLWNGNNGIVIFQTLTNFSPEASFLINENDELIFAIPTVDGKIHINILKPDGTLKNEENTVVNFSTNPLLALGTNGFYLLYVTNERYFVNAYSNNLVQAWEYKYVGNETAMGAGLNTSSTVVKPDGDGGIFILWEKNQLYLQRMNKLGERLLTDNGFQISTNAKSVASSLFSVDAEAETVSISWYSNNTTTFLTLAQKVTFEGEKLWGEDGITLAQSQNVSNLNYPVAIASTENNHTLIVFSRFNLSSSLDELVFVNLKNDGSHTLGGSGFATVNSEKANRSFFASTDFSNNQLVIAWASTVEGVASDNLPIAVKAQNVTFYGDIGAGASDISDKFSITNNSLKIFPHPVVSNFTVNYFSDFVEKGALRIFDISGRLQYFDSEIILQQGENNFSIDCNLPKGTYYIELQTSSGKTNQIFIVK